MSNMSDKERQEYEAHLKDFDNKIENAETLGVKAQFATIKKVYQFANHMSHKENHYDGQDICVIISVLAFIFGMINIIIRYIFEE